MASPAKGFPPQPVWFRDNRDRPKIGAALTDAGFTSADADKLMGGNWRCFFDDTFSTEVK